jgi:hypothetical protein
MKKFRYLFLLVLLGWFSNSEAQTISVKGVVKDTSQQKSPLSKTLVVATRVRDSILLSFTRTNLKGEYALQNLPIDTFQLTFYHTNSDPHTLIVIGDLDHTQLLINPIYLSTQTKQFATVNVNAYKVPIYHKGDTLVYVADSFKVKQNAVVEDLLKKLPGIKVNINGKVTAQGKEVKRIYVDGDEFFGNDLTIATKNLSSNSVETVQVYEQSVSTSGNETTEQVMNLTLKDDAKNGYFGKVEGAFGDRKFYEAEALFSKFKDKEKYSVYNLSSNTNRSGFDWSESDKYNMGNEFLGNIDENGEESYNYFSDFNNNGIPQINKGGLHYQNRFGKFNKSKYSIDYSIANNELITTTETRNQFFLNDTTFYTNDLSNLKRNSTKHILKTSLSIPLDTFTKLEYTPVFQFDDEKDIYDQSVDYENLNQETVRKNTNENSNSLNRWSLLQKFSINKEYQKKKRKTSISGFTYYNSDDQQIMFSNLDQYVLEKKINQAIQQNKFGSKKIYFSVVDFEHLEPISKHLKVGVQYQFKYGKNNSIFETNDLLNGVIQERNIEFSNNFNSTSITQRFAPLFSYEKSNHLVKLVSNYNSLGYSTLNLDDYSSSSQFTQRLLPEFFYEFKNQSNFTLKLNYRSDSKLPSIKQIRPLKDNLNPNFIIEGNPDLKPNFKQSVRFELIKYSALSNFWLQFSSSINVKQNDFTTSTIFDNQGRTFSKTINTNGNYTYDQYLDLAIPLKRNYTLSCSNYLTYSLVNSYINSLKNEAVLLVVSPRIGLNYYTDSLSFNIGYQVSFNSPKNTISQSVNQPSLSEEISVYFNWDLPIKGVRLIASVKNTRTSQRTEGFNLNYTVCNLSIQKAFLKTKNLIFKLEGIDLFNQNIITERLTNQNIVTDNRTMIISRYFLVRLTFNFNSTKTKENDD